MLKRFKTNDHRTQHIHGHTIAQKCSDVPDVRHTIPQLRACSTIVSRTTYLTCHSAIQPGASAVVSVQPQATSAVIGYSFLGLVRTQCRTLSLLLVRFRVAYVHMLVCHIGKLMWGRLYNARSKHEALCKLNNCVYGSAFVVGTLVRSSTFEQQLTCILVRTATSSVIKLNFILLQKYMWNASIGVAECCDAPSDRLPIIAYHIMLDLRYALSRSHFSIRIAHAYPSSH